jgi:hypothetical protein
MTVQEDEMVDEEKVASIRKFSAELVKLALERQQ